MALERLKLLCDEASTGDLKEHKSLISGLGAIQCTLEDLEEGTKPDLLITSSVLCEAYQVFKSVFAEPSERSSNI